MPDASKGPEAPVSMFLPELLAVRAAKGALQDRRRAWLAQSLGEPVPTAAAYRFTLTDGRETDLAGLFGSQADLLVVHNMGRACKYCTMWADGFIGLARHIERRAAFVLTSPDPVEVLAAHAAARGWTYRCASLAAASPFARDMGYQLPTGEYWPGVSGFHRAADGAIYRTGTTRFGPGDDFCGAWPMFNLLRGEEAAFEPQ
ncbi:MAG: DUF899 family protein [Phycisphaerales bacterium]|jgi:predicted dithiol-disulfide oxidoreductase (DUF899 family)|nr:DUF899 family protein [Phycisphaerales bacterium]